MQIYNTPVTRAGGSDSPFRIRLQVPHSQSTRTTTKVVVQYSTLLDSHRSTTTTYFYLQNRGSMDEPVW